MLEGSDFKRFKTEVETATSEDLVKLDDLRKEVRLLGIPSTIKDYSTTAVSLVSSDGGNNRLRFDPFEIQIIRVVDSYGMEGCLDVVSRYADVNKISDQQFKNGEPCTPLGEMMADLGVHTLQDLSPMLKPRLVEGRKVLSPSWVLVYRDFWEWAILYDKLRNGNFVTDTLIVIDGLLRSKVFRDDLFVVLVGLMQKHIARIRNTQHRNVYLVGVAKRSKVVDRYQLAMMLEAKLREPRAVYALVPKDIEDRAYEWPEYTRRPEDVVEGGEKAKFVGGRLYLAKFGPRPGDPIWPVDVLLGQEPQVDRIMGYLKSDADVGFPVPYFPRCVQKAHEYSTISGIDADILQDEILRTILKHLEGKDVDSFEEFVLRPRDPGGARYE